MINNAKIIPLTELYMQLIMFRGTCSFSFHFILQFLQGRFQQFKSFTLFGISVTTMYPFTV